MQYQIMKGMSREMEQMTEKMSRGALTPEQGLVLRLPAQPLVGKLAFTGRALRHNLGAEDG